jgi:hypothetical protein
VARMMRNVLTLMALLGVAVLGAPGAASAAEEHPTAYSDVPSSGKNW